MLLVICPGFSTNYFYKNGGKLKLFGHKEGHKHLCSLAICAKSSSNLPIMEKTYQKFQ
jgi:hypothetical protein